jgi:hypothetical protein
MGPDRIGSELTLQEDLIVRDLGDGDTSDLELLGLSRANRKSDDGGGDGRDARDARKDEMFRKEKGRSGRRCQAKRSCR